jgi:hypothetical protein
LLVPASGGAPWLEDVAFQRRNRVGIQVLAPGDTPNVISPLLKEFIHAES